LILLFSKKTTQSRFSLSIPLFSEYNHKQKNYCVDKTQQFPCIQNCTQEGDFTLSNSNCTSIYYLLSTCIAIIHKNNKFEKMQRQTNTFLESNTLIIGYKPFDACISVYSKIDSRNNTDNEFNFDDTNVTLHSFVDPLVYQRLNFIMPLGTIWFGILLSILCFGSYCSVCIRY